MENKYDTGTQNSTNIWKIQYLCESEPTELTDFHTLTE